MVAAFEHNRRLPDPDPNSDSGSSLVVVAANATSTEECHGVSTSTLDNFKRYIATNDVAGLRKLVRSTGMDTASVKLEVNFHCG